MTRSHKANDPVHNGEAQAAQQGAQDPLPRNFGKHASHTDPPNKAKKNGGGKANWGREGDELQDSAEFRMHNPRRRSNSKGHIEDMFVNSKFEEAEEESVLNGIGDPIPSASPLPLETTEKS